MQSDRLLTCALDLRAHVLMSQASFSL